MNTPVVITMMMKEECDLMEAVWEGIATVGSPYFRASATCFCLVIGTFVVSTLSKNYSQVDKLWSIVPVIYTWMTVVDDRTLLMACLATVWGVRLTWNFSRRGGYQWPPWLGDEDYRWEVIRTGGFVKALTNPILWVMFNFGFISLYQNVLLLWIAAPSFVAHTMATCKKPKEALYWGDWAVAALILMFVVIESIADNQQFAFQTEKYRLKAAGEKLSGEYADGFRRSGLFSIVRKPNYAAEQCVWICFYLFTLTAGAPLWNWSGVGCVLLVQLFQLSGWFTEKITLEKYPKYKEYKKRVPLYLPNPIHTAKIKEK